jgi:hypothetical protein
VVMKDLLECMFINVFHSRLLRQLLITR